MVSTIITLVTVTSLQSTSSSPCKVIKTYIARIEII